MCADVQLGAVDNKPNAESAAKELVKYVADVRSRPLAEVSAL